jgi:hypothetical protein
MLIRIMNTIKKFMMSFQKKYGVEKLTVAQLGGIECAKCHY